MSDYTEKNSNLIPKIDIPCFAWNSQAEQGLLFFKAKSLLFDKVMNQNFVPVVDDKKVFIGIVTRKDVLAYLGKKAAAQV